MSVLSHHSDQSRRVERMIPESVCSLCTSECSSNELLVCRNRHSHCNECVEHLLQDQLARSQADYTEEELRDERIMLPCTAPGCQRVWGFTEFVMHISPSLCNTIMDRQNDIGKQKEKSKCQALADFKESIMQDEITAVHNLIPHGQCRDESSVMRKKLYEKKIEIHDAETAQEEFRSFYRSSSTASAAVYTAKQCPRCQVGPVEHAYCSSLTYHQGDRMHGSNTAVNNACHGCGWCALLPSCHLPPPHTPLNPPSPR